MANPWQWPPNPADDHILRTSNTEAACLARAGALASGLANHCGCPVGQDASHWPTPSVGPLDRKRTALANHFGCALDRKRTASGQPLRLSLISLSQPPSVVPLVKMHRVGQPPFGCALDRKCTALANPLRLCPRSKVHRVRPTQRPYSHLANHLGCACQPFRLCCQLLQLCLPAITAVPPSFGDRCDRPGRSAGPVFGFTCQPSRLCLPTISVVLPAIAAVLASYYSCAPIFWGPLRSAWPIGRARLRIHLPTISVVLANHFGCAASYCSCACQLLQLCPHLLGTVAIGLADRPGPSSDSPANHLGCASFPSGGAPAGASLHLRLPLRRRRPRREYADCIYGTDCADCGPRFPPPPPICAPRRATGLPTPIATTAAPARSSARPRADGTCTIVHRHKWSTGKVKAVCTL